jgi:hypothetical protein
MIFFSTESRLNNAEDGDKWSLKSGLITTIRNTMEIQKDILIEELVENKPEAVTYLSKKGIKCLACGEPIWGTLEEAAKEKGFSDQEIDTFVEDLNQL